MSSIIFRFLCVLWTLSICAICEKIKKQRLYHGILSQHFLTDDTDEQKEQISFLAHSNAQRPKGRRNHRFIVDELTSGQVNQLLVDGVIKDKVTDEQSSFE